MANTYLVYLVNNRKCEDYIIKGVYDTWRLALEAVNNHRFYDLGEDYMWEVYIVPMWVNHDVMWSHRATYTQREYNGTEYYFHAPSYYVGYADFYTDWNFSYEDSIFYITETYKGN